MLNSKRKELVRVLNNELNEYSLDNNFQEKVANELKKRNLTVGDISKLLKKMSPLQTQDDMILYFLAEAIHKVNYKEVISPVLYFTESEIQNYKNKKIKKQDRIEYPLVFQPVIKINDNEYMLKMSEKEIYDLFAKRIIIYNTKTQRPLKSSGDIDINEKSIKEISKRTIDDEQKIDPVTINVLDNGDDVLEYVETDLKLVIYSGALNIIDGFHRSMGYKTALDFNPNIKFDVSVIITNYDEDNANDYIVQKDKRNVINKAYIKRKDPNRKENKIIDRLDDRKKSDIAGKISFRMSDVNDGTALTTTDILLKALEENFKLELNADAMKAGRFLVNFFNMLMSYYPDEFLHDISSYRDVNYVNHPNVFIGYMAIASEIIGRNDWEDVLENTLLNIDFSKDNVEWKEINIEKNKIGKKYVKEVSEFFKSKIVY